MSNIKLKNQIRRCDDPQSIFKGGDFSDYKYVIKSDQSDVVIFAKDKKFFKNRKPYIKKLLISDERFKKSEELLKQEKLIDSTTSSLLSETISNMANENAKLRETCELTSSLMRSQHDTAQKLIQLNKFITFDMYQYEIDLNNKIFLSQLEHGSYFIQQLDELDSNNINRIHIFKIPENVKATIYNTICVGIFVAIVDKDKLKLIDYRNYNYGKSYLTIAKEQWGFEHSFTSLLRERPMVELYENTIISTIEKMPVYDMGDEKADNKLSLNIESIVCIKRVHDAIYNMIN